MDILFIAHQASRTGAPILLLRLLQWLKVNSSLQFSVLLQRSGDLHEEFCRLCPTWQLELPRRFRRLPGYGTRDIFFAKIHRRIVRNRIAGTAPRLIYANTADTAPALDFLQTFPCPVLTHVHELEFSLQHTIGDARSRRVIESTKRFIAVSEAVKTNLLQSYGCDAADVDVVRGFLDCSRCDGAARDRARTEVRGELGVHADSLLIAAAGALYWGKGSDLFVPLAKRVTDRCEDEVHFVWLGENPSQGMGPMLRHDALKAGVGERVHFVGEKTDILKYFYACDTFVLPSREDSFPLVVLEAASTGAPIVAFEGAGGAPEFIGSDAGFVVPYLDLEAMACCVVNLLADKTLRRRMGDEGARRVRQAHDVTIAAPQILRIIETLLLES